MKFPLAIKYQLIFLLFGALLFAPIGVWAKDDCFPKKPTEKSLVFDYADLLTPSQEGALRQKLEGFAQSNSTQILVVTDIALW